MSNPAFGRTVADVRALLADLKIHTIHLMVRVSRTGHEVFTISRPDLLRQLDLLPPFDPLPCELSQGGEVLKIGGIAAIAYSESKAIAEGAAQ
jgi:hypothetical protein